MGLEQLRKKLNIKRHRVLERYSYYEMKENNYISSNVIPIKLQQQHKSRLGWCTKAVDSLADRLLFNGFDNDNFEFMNIFNINNPDILFDSAILSALISSCSFIYISKDQKGDIRLQVIDGANATGNIDPITGLLTEGYAVLKRNADTDEVELESYFEPYKTTIIDKVRGTVTEFTHSVAYPLLVPIIYKADAKRPFGHSRISRACINLQNKAKLTLTRGDISAEFYSFPQKYILGLSDDVEEFDKEKANISSFLAFWKDSDGDKPTVGQFTQQSMEPHISQFRMYASAFAGETGLTLDDLGFTTDNPSSAEAIKASHENLRLTAKKAQRTFGTGFLNVGYLAKCLEIDTTFQREAIYQTIPKWLPVFEPDSAMLSSIGDGAIKLNQAIDGFITEKNLGELTGIKGGE